MIFPCSPCPMFPRYPMIIPSIPYVSWLHLHCFPIIIHYKPIFIHINPYFPFFPYHPIILVGILPWSRRKPLGIAAPTPFPSNERPNVMVVVQNGHGPPPDLASERPRPQWDREKKTCYSNDIYIYIYTNM